MEEIIERDRTACCPVPLVFWALLLPLGNHRHELNPLPIRGLGERCQHFRVLVFHLEHVFHLGHLPRHGVGHLRFEGQNFAVGGAFTVANRVGHGTHPGADVLFLLGVEPDGHLADHRQVRGVALDVGNKPEIADHAGRFRPLAFQRRLARLHHAFVFGDPFTRELLQPLVFLRRGRRLGQIRGTVGKC